MISSIAIIRIFEHPLIDWFFRRIDPEIISIIPRGIRTRGKISHEKATPAIRLHTPDPICIPPMAVSFHGFPLLLASFDGWTPSHRRILVTTTPLSSALTLAFSAEDALTTSSVSKPDSLSTPMILKSKERFKSGFIEVLAIAFRSAFQFRLMLNSAVVMRFHFTRYGLTHRRPWANLPRMLELVTS